ncbi:hypothetical protein PCANC_08866 [Puccinia coronata f. sp. avenae]|uniref:Pre-rRNA-processing protein n=1 Tax=Puccinia coronata f. sp. avenae TaxID=200324 RepID=A0A2N5VS56_9BASI|nr:hypothetical protein PCASD_23145 [Puccinia coronata f. sp. avenae]PLW52829.1 hypothetical protein PCANC_08866 [Puccinia coronata f. sp. avenae]
MPKSQKQKKAKAADFTKAKLKLGKGKQAANNATNTSYSSKVIALPNQKIRTEDTSIPTTKSNLTLDDLIVRLRHYSANTRKDALLGLRELLEAHRTIWRLNLGTVIHSCASLISDENAGVRKALKTFFSWFLPRVELSLLKPFCSVIIFFAGSALSHIFADIRVDAIYIIDILLDVAPDCVVAGWPCDQRADLQLDNGTSRQSTNLPQQPGPRLLQLYLSLLSIGSDSAAPGLSSTSSNQLSGNSKLVVMKSLARFIGAASSLEDQHAAQTSMPLWIFRSAFRKERDFDAFRGLLADPPAQDDSASMGGIVDAQNHSSTNSHMFERFTEAFLESDDFAQEKMANPPGLCAESTGPSNPPTSTHPTPDSSLHLLRAMHPVLLSLFLDTAPTAFQSELSSTAASVTKSSSTASVSPSLELVNCVVTCLHRLWQATMAAGLSIETKDVKSLDIILTKMSPYFVFGADDITAQGTELKRLLQHLNLMYCDLVSLLALVKPDGNNNTVAIQLNRVGNYITRLLENKVISLNSNVGTMNPEAYRGLFPIVWSLLRHDLIQRENPNAERETWASRVVEAFIDHLNDLSPNSELKYLGVNFLARLCIMDDLPGCQLACELDVLSPETQEKLQQWLLGLPKLLWQLGSKNPRTSHLVLSFLHRVVSRPMMFFEKCLADLPPLLVPFFSIVNPFTGRTIPGPYSRLPPSCRKLSEAICWYLLHLPDSLPRSDPLKSALQICNPSFEQSLVCSS